MKIFARKSLLFGKRTPEFKTNTDEPSLLRLLKITKSFSDWQGDGLADKTIVIGELPAGGIPIGVKVKTSVAFQNSGGTMTFGTDLIVDGTSWSQAGSSGDTRFNVHEPVTATKGGFHFKSFVAHDGLGYKIPDQNAPSDIKGRLLVVDGSGGVIDDLIVGEVDIWIWYVVGV